MKLDKTLFSRVALLLSIVFLVYTVASTSILDIGPDSLGLPSELPVVFYVGLGLVCCLWYVGFKSKFYLPAALVLTFAYLYVAPMMVRVPVWISNSYYPYGESLLINANGHITYNPAASMVSYHFWPLYLYFASGFTLITGMSTEAVLKFFPVFTVAVYGLLTVLILRVKLAFRYACAGSAVVMASLFIRQQYFGPQAIAYIFFLAIVLIVTLLFFEKTTKPRTLASLLFPLLVLTTFLHPLTSFMALAVMLAFYLSNRLTHAQRPFKFNRLFLVAIVIWLAYNSYAAAPFFRIALEHYAQMLTGSRGLTLVSESSRVIASPAMQINFYAQYAIVALNGLFVALALFKILRHIRLKRTEMAFTLFNVFMLLFFGAFAFGGEYGAVEAYQRAFMFALVPMSFLSVSFLMPKRKVLLVGLVIALIFLNLPAQYGADTYRLATAPQLAGSAFVADYTPNKINLVGEFTLYIRYFEPTKLYTILNVGLSSPYSHVPNSTELNKAVRNADYVILSEVQSHAFQFYIGQDPMAGLDTSDLVRVYDNGEYQLLRPMNATDR